MFVCYVAVCLTETPTKLGSSAEREVICVTLKKDPKLGLGEYHTPSTDVVDEVHSRI